MPVRFDAAAALETANTPLEAQAVWQGIVEDLGFATFDYASGRLTTARPRSVLDLQFDWYFATRDWTRHYFERGYHTVDKGSLMSLTRTTPWTYELVLDRRPDNPLEREMQASVLAVKG